MTLHLSALRKLATAAMPRHTHQIYAGAEWIGTHNYGWSYKPLTDAFKPADLLTLIERCEKAEAELKEANWILEGLRK